VKLRTILVIVIAGLGVYVVLPRHQAAPRPAVPSSPAPKRQIPDYEAYRYGRGDSEKTIDVGNIPTGVSSLFTIQGLFHDRILARQLAAEGWQLRSHPYRSGKDVIPFADGRLDILTLGDTEALVTVQKHNVGIFAAIRQGTNAVIANRRLLPSELKGLRIGYTPGTTLQFTLERALEAAHLTERDILSVHLQPDEMQAALLDHRVDAVATLEPFTSMILRNVPGSAATFSSDSYTYLLADLDFATRHPALLKAVLAAVVRAAHWGRVGEGNLSTGLQWVRQENIRYSGQSSVEATSQWISLLQRETIGNPSFPLLPLNSSSDLGVQYRQFDFLKRSGLLPRDSDWQKVRGNFNIEALPEILRHSEAWQIDHFDYAPESLLQGGGGTP